MAYLYCILCVYSILDYKDFDIVYIIIMYFMYNNNNNNNNSILICTIWCIL